jgi:hypothetical protein
MKYKSITSLSVADYRTVLVNIDLAREQIKRAENSTNVYDIIPFLKTAIAVLLRGEG